LQKIDPTKPFGKLKVSVFSRSLDGLIPNPPHNFNNPPPSIYVPVIKNIGVAVGVSAGTGDAGGIVYCDSCHHKNDYGMSFCEKCGEELDGPGNIMDSYFMSQRGFAGGYGNPMY
jgi:hypothetical protein